MAELPEKDNIQEGMKNPDPLILDIEEQAALREAIKTRIKNGDVTVSHGCLASGPGHWKPLLNGEKEEAAMLNVFAKIAMGEVPTNIRQTLMTGLLMAQDEDGKKGKTNHHPSFVLRASLSAIGGCLKSEAAEQIGPTQMGMGTPDGCALVFGLLKAWSAADKTKCIISIDAGGAHSIISRKMFEATTGKWDTLLNLWYGIPGRKSGIATQI